MLLFHRIAKDANKSLNTKSLEIQQPQDSTCRSTSGVQAAQHPTPVLRLAAGLGLDLASGRSRVLEIHCREYCAEMYRKDSKAI